MQATTGDPVHTIMGTPAVRVEPAATLLGAAILLQEQDIGSVVVPGTDGLDGVLSERDIVCALADGADPFDTSVAAVMARHPLVADADMPIGDVADLMLATGVRHLPVVAGHEVVGMVSMRDVLEVCRGHGWVPAGAHPPGRP
jgi:CBS domain-containing protein